MSDDARIEKLELFAWVGEDELGSGKVGLKCGMVPAGFIPLVTVKDDAGKICGDIVQALQQQADIYGKTIRLCRFVFAEEVHILRPRS